MSDDRLIQTADLRQIERGLSAMAAGLDQVRVDVSVVGSEVQSTRADLSRLWTEFQAFLQADRKAKQLQLAETRIVKVRQELENRFGHHAEVRRRTTGILQASDVRLVRQETIKAATENLMLAAPGYWLAPALVALSAWLSDDSELALRAAVEGAKRDDEKTSIFFALVCRRANRLSASGVWLERFFAIQDPNEVDREAIVLIDAVASGVFGAEARNRCTIRFDQWTKTLSERAGFVEAQREQWRKALASRNAAPNESRYLALSKVSPTWPSLQKALHGARLHGAILAHFKAVFDGPIKPSATVQAAVDELLNKLVTEFDGEELPLRRDERMFQLIIDMEGDRDTAQRRFDLEKQAHVERVSFTQLLTNAAMHAESSKASVSTQRFATALSRQWIASAHADLTAESRASVPGLVELGVAGWSGTSADGSNERQLAESLQGHLQAEEERALEKAMVSPLAWFGLVAGAALGVYGAVSPNVVACAAALLCILICANEWSSKNKVRAEISAKAAEARTSALGALRAALAALVDCRREYASMDARAADVTAFLATLAPHEHVRTPHDANRNILA
jgi:hypothetical protein